MEPLPIMLFSFMFGFPLYRIVPLPAILVDIALFAVISIWVLPAALQVSSSVSRPNALILLLPALLIFIFSVLPLRETVPLPAISQSKRVMAMESAFIVPPPANLIPVFAVRPLPKSQLPPPAILNSFSAVELVITIKRVGLIPVCLFLGRTTNSLLSVLISRRSYDILVCLDFQIGSVIRLHIFEVDVSPSIVSRRNPLSGFLAYDIAVTGNLVYMAGA